MRIVRLPGIHHDSNVILVIGTLGNIIIDSGTSWYQSLQLERIRGILEDDQEKQNNIDRILLTSRRFPCSGGAKHLSNELDNCPIHIHLEGQSSLETGDFLLHGQTDLIPICQQRIRKVLVTTKSFRLVTDKYVQCRYQVTVLME